MFPLMRFSDPIQIPDSTDAHGNGRRNKDDQLGEVLEERRCLRPQVKLCESRVQPSHTQ